MTELNHENVMEETMNSLFNRVEKSEYSPRTLVLDGELEKKVEEVAARGNTASLKFQEPIKISGKSGTQKVDNMLEDDCFEIVIESIGVSIY